MQDKKCKNLSGSENPLRALRYRLRVGRHQMAKMLGISESYLAKVEVNQKPLTRALQYRMLQTEASLGPPVHGHEGSEVQIGTAGADLRAAPQISTTGGNLTCPTHQSSALRLLKDDALKSLLHEGEEQQEWGAVAEIAWELKRRQELEKKQEPEP